MGGTNSKLEEALIKDFPPTEKLTGFVNVKKKIGRTNIRIISFTLVTFFFNIAWNNLLLQQRDSSVIQLLDVPDGRD